MQELAEFLKSERLKQGLPLGEVSKRANMSMSMLEALEEGNFERIGAPLLIRGFIEAYCTALRIDSKPLLARYTDVIASYDRQKEGIERYGKWARTFRRRRRLGLPGGLLLLLTIVVAFYSGVSVMERRFAPHRPVAIYSEQLVPSDLRGDIKETAPIEETPKKPEVNLAAADPDPAATAGPAREEREHRDSDGMAREVPPAQSFSAMGSPTEVMAEDRISEPPPKSRLHRFKVAADQKTWVEVRTDDKKPQSAMLQPGDSREWEAERGMQVIVGNAGGVRMTWDEQSVNFPGKPGRVLRFRLPDGIQSGEEQHNPT